MPKTKKRKPLEKKPPTNMFLGGGLDFLVLGGIIAIIYHTLYTLIMVEASPGDVSHTLILQVLQAVGMLLLFLGVVVLSYSSLVNHGDLKRDGGAFLVSGGALCIPAAVASTYYYVTAIEGQTMTLESFLTQTMPTLLNDFSKVYILMGVLFLGIFFWERRRQRTWAAACFSAGAVTWSGSLVVAFYNTYDLYQTFMEMYSTSRDLIISQFLIPEVLSNTSQVLVVIGLLLLAISYLQKRNLQRWAGRFWTFGGAFGVFHGFVRLSLDSKMIQNEMTGVRQSIMELTPYTTTFKDISLVIETMKEFYAKVMIPTYLEEFMMIAVFSAITAIGVYLWTKRYQKRDTG
ncbi:MAG: hypothetical protein HXS41_00110 [Theionarchaea archaeon]|nr:hypothetical protein [Theionarchaea archaeon]MBU7001372.1 hypothetical protein [Theionarchaea archaeon]MBU7019433.1 hypothetical protein [Theionarchaea archaeon]MBU7034843.1 hypothetical protein [Theionarchaea archaeon]